MKRRLMETLGFGVVALALVLGITAFAPADVPKTTKVVPPQGNQSVCAPASEDGELYAANAETLTVLGEGGKQEVRSPAILDDLEDPVVLNGTVPPTAGWMNTGEDTRTWTSCGVPRAAGMLLVPKTESTELLIVNPDKAEAAVDLTLFGPDGEIQALGARGIAVSARNSRKIALSVLADEAGPVGVSYRANRGRAMVIARTKTSDGLLSTPAFKPDGQQFLPGVPSEASEATVLLANPTTESVKADVTAHSTTASYVPEGGADIAVPPGTAVEVPLVDALAGEAATLEVNSTGELAAALTVGGPEDDRAIVPAGDLADDMLVFVPEAGVLQLTAPHDDARVALTQTVAGEDSATDVEVDRGTTVTVPLEGEAEDGRLLHLTSDQPISAAVVFMDDKGTAVVPIAGAAEDRIDPLAAELNPLLR